MTSDSDGDVSRSGSAPNTPAAKGERPPLPPHFSLLRSFTMADFITLLNAASGVSSIFASIEHAVSGKLSYAAVAAALVLVAALADFFDGRVARRSRRSSTLGGDLDSLADLISFGVAPACLAYSLGMNGGWDWLVLVYFVCCGLSRLARYNVTAGALSDESGKVRYFEGTPIPTSLFLVLVLAVLLGTGRVREQLPGGALELGPALLHPLVLLYLISGSAMISARLRVPKP
ncbi:MAG TPA: CDP-diacylglycerol--serine O-phosphatidyltransferase [Polyangiaceae bacterium]|nr:CDP-diacylglycerol--serine O-phosphatidyltransferase [Polyangiaceae bacterium]